ncbi:ABC-type multidrug transport system, ATPase component [Halanaeroarchaeum sp. HSR-CO]|uniref:ABC transporter ATP-binding protein n=1 Tax=Halanaeroarchaeum sp. HSR-CO TaxID=2866382 RepID=UPI00217D7AD9|nr:ABC transporter ATP-binding protein [Halanaeroarchaeum sp. HSR-CO]UWG48238.1 ABC-type multidrug transport system, ATPase component [Halanaeroarchaeum sp. HSR-CO]
MTAHVTGQRTADAETVDAPETVRRETAGDPVIVTDGVARTYGKTVALDGVSATVRSGEIFALVGPNGAGKTTFVRTLTGTVSPDSGTVSVFGGPPSAVDSERVGVLPQSFSPPGRLTAREIVSYYAGLYESARDPSAVLEDVGLRPDRETFYEDLSGGQQRRVAVAATLVNDPELVFLDEPTTAIDPAGRHRLWEHFEEVAADGRTIVLTTHDMAEAERLADRVGFLAAGRLLKTGSPADLVGRYGGESRLVVKTDDAPPEVDGYEVTYSRDGLVVTGIGPEQIGDVARTLTDEGVSFDALSWREPTLEDAYLSLVGDNEREGEE